MSTTGYPHQYGMVEGSVPSSNLSNEFLDDFKEISASSSTNEARWLISLSGGGSSVVMRDDTEGGAVRITSGNQAQNHILLKLNGQSFSIREGSELIFRAVIRIPNSATAEVVIGLHDATIQDFFPPPNDLNGFGFKVEAGEKLAIFSGDGTAASFKEEFIDGVKDEYFELLIRCIEKGPIEFWIKEKNAVVATGIINERHPTGLLVPFFSVEGVGSTNEELDVAHISVLQRDIT